MSQFATAQLPMGSTGAATRAPGLGARLRRAAAVMTALAAAATSLTGCAAIGNCFGWRQLPPPGPRPSAVVLDFAQAPRVVERRDTCRNLVLGEKEVETEKDRRGWWFGSQDTYHNANWGLIMADLVEEKIREDSIFELRSRSDVKYYYADKRDVLAEKLKLEGEELDRAVLKLNPVSVGREMGVDKVVVGQVVDAELRFDRTLGYYCAVASVNVSVYDTASGNLEFTRNIMDTRGHSTVYGLLEKIAEGFSSQMKSHYGSPVVPRYSLRR